MNILVTSSSFWNTPGAHHEALKSKGLSLDYKGGPLSKEEMMNIHGSFEGIICGDDVYDAEVLAKLKGQGLRVLSKYGVGLDKVDKGTASELDILVRNCKGVNQTTVAEHTFALMMSFYKNLQREFEVTRSGQWERLTSRELRGKTIGVVGVGSIGKEVVKLASAFGMNVCGFDKFFDEEFAEKWEIKKASTIEELAENCDLVTLHSNLDSESKGLIGEKFFRAIAKPSFVLINTARAGLVDRRALENAVESKTLTYLADVWFEEPMKKDDQLAKMENVFITPHIGSRTYENVEKQGLMAVNNLFQSLQA